MRSHGSAEELERRRRLAFRRVNEGYRQREVAAILGVTERSLNRWVCLARKGGADALKAKPTPGRPRKLSTRQEKTVLSWMGTSPTHFGFPDELWTSRRLASLIEERFGVHFNANYLVEWLTLRGLSAQKPVKKALERSEAAIMQWVGQEWPRMGKKPGRRERISC